MLMWIRGAPGQADVGEAPARCPELKSSSDSAVRGRRRRRPCPERPPEAGAGGVTPLFVEKAL